MVVKLKPSVYRTTFGLLNYIVLGNLPSFAAVAAIIESKNKFLLIDRSDNLGLSLPGGIVKWGETCEAALKRELVEETGYEVAVTRLVGVYSGQDRDPRFSCVEIVYAASIIGGSETGSDEGQIRWIARTALPVTLGFDHQLVITDYLMIRNRGL